jgi:hypothetical protein
MRSGGKATDEYAECPTQNAIAKCHRTADVTDKTKCVDAAKKKYGQM